jgi:hypothetical protein
MLLADGIRRLRFRDGYRPADTAAGVPGTVYEMVIELPDIANTFLAGHRIRVDVTSANYPRYDCNLNNGLTMYTAGDSLVASNHVYLNSTFASYVELPIVDYAGGISESTDHLQAFQVMPNPATSFIEVSFSSPDLECRMLSVYSNNGSCVYRKSIDARNGTCQIDVTNWAQGLYLVSDGTRYKKIIVMH